ncbi:MAG UNVERIFIED_CONTAM: hypothetical protein LVR18_12670 [Planctomycetaceae bacterium]|jgi:hypothetical protein
MRKNRRPRIYFASQIAGSPPTIVLKCNDSTLLDEAWKRYLFGFLREATPFREVPIRLVLRSRNEIDPDAVALPEDDQTEPPDLTELDDLGSDDSTDDHFDDDNLQSFDSESLLFLTRATSKTPMNQLRTLWTTRTGLDECGPTLRDRR